MQLAFPATTDKKRAEERLDRLLVRGPLRDACLERKIPLLSHAFESFARTSPLPMWAPGLVLTREMRSLTEALFPVRPVAAAFALLVRRSCLFSPFLPATPLESAASFLDLLQRMQPEVRRADPAATLRELAADDELRRRFLFSLFLPRRYGSAFERYPQQAGWLRAWLAQNARRLSRRVRALDCACGTGEGTYRLAELVAEAGFIGGECVVHGSTVEPLELFAAAHAFFPHDPAREASFRKRVAPLLLDGAGPGVSFYLDDVTSRAAGAYDVILCNGLLGGPMLGERDAVRGAVVALAARLAPGGVLLAADTFHEGWKKRLPDAVLRSVFEECGLRSVEVPEGVGGEKRRQA